MRQPCSVFLEYLEDYDKDAWGPVGRHTQFDAGFDLRACEEVLLEPGEHALIPLGIRTKFSTGFEAQLRARSGLALKHGISLVNGVGTIDAMYEGEWGAILINLGKEPFLINRGDRIVQVVFNELPPVQIIPCSVQSDGTGRGGGFGSSGMK